MIKLLIVLVAIVFIAQVVRIFEIGNLLSKTKNEVSDGSNNMEWNFSINSWYWFSCFLFLAKS